MLEMNLNLHRVTEKIIYADVQDDASSLIIRKLCSIQNKFHDTISFLHSLQEIHNSKCLLICTIRKKIIRNNFKFSKL